MIENSSFDDALEQAKLGTAVLSNGNGKFVRPTAEPTDEHLNLVHAPGADA